MPDTDYDDLPSPPRARTHGRTGAVGAAGRLYGRKAARKPVGASAHHGGGGGASGAGSGRDSSASDDAASVGGGPQRSSRSARGQGAARGQGGRAGKVTRRSKEREASEGSDVGEDDEIGLGVAPGGASRIKGKLHPARPSSASTARRPSSAPVVGPSHPVDAGGPTVDRAGRATRPATEDEEHEHDKRSRSIVTSTQRARTSRGSSPFSSPRKLALADKSNLTADSPRKITRARPSQLALPGPSSSTSSSLSPRASGSSLGIFRDLPSTSAAAYPAASTSSHLAPPQPVQSTTTQPASRPRAPRAALVAQSVPLRATTFSASFSRSPSPDLSAADRALNPPPSPRVPQQASPARLAVPGGSRPSLGAPGMPAPWALAAPAGEHSSSPRRAHEPAVARGAPVFRYTMSEFDDAPSLNLSLGDGGAVEDDGAGMESSIVLETWEDEQSRRSAARGHELDALLAEAAEQGMADDEGGDEEEEGDMTLRPGAVLLDLSAGEATPLDDGAGAEQGGGAPEQDGEETEGEEDNIVLVGVEPRAREPVVAPDSPIEDNGDETLKAQQLPPARPDGAALVQDDPQQAAAPANADENRANLHPISPDRTSSSSSAGSPRRRLVKASFSASIMPPRRPRPSVDKPLDDGPPSDEDPLGYALRTTATYSSEDDLPDSAPSNESALEDNLAEREVGRAVKPTSGQRDKRIAASARATRLRLVEGAREGLERTVLDVDEAKADGVVLRLIEARAEGANEEEEEEALEAWRRQKRRWAMGGRD